MLKTLIFGKVITREDINHVALVTHEPLETFSKLYNLSEIEFLKRVGDGKIRYRGFCLRLLWDLIVLVFSKLFKGKN